MNRPFAVLLLALAACTLPRLETPEKFLDGDDDGVTEADGDCEPEDEAIFPGAVEVCDGFDNDCTGLADDVVGTNVEGGDPFWYDVDRDGYGDAQAPIMACHLVEGIAANDDDCNDANVAVNPGVTSDPCNDTDDDCDGVKDEDAAGVLWRDLDIDGYGNPADPWCEASTPPNPHASNPDDCDDTKDDVYPGADEYCDDLDNDCNDDVDDDPVDAQTVCFDDDEDGFGDPATVVTGCVEPGGGWLFECSDCDDTDEDVLDTRTWYADTDGDFYGDDSTTEEVCDIPSTPPNWVLVGGDCAIGEPTINPGAQEVCENGVDDDCDETSDCRFPSGLRVTASPGGADVRIDGQFALDRTGTFLYSALIDADDRADTVIQRQRSLAPAELVVVQGTDVRPDLPLDIVDVIKTQFQPDLQGSDAFGTSFAQLGDLDGDAYPEVVAGDPTAHIVAAAEVTGSAYVFFSDSGVVTPPKEGDPTPWPTWTPDLRLDGAAAGDLFGLRVVKTPGARGDPDAFAVSAPGANGGDGAVYLVQISEYDTNPAMLNVENAPFAEKWAGPADEETAFGTGLAFFEGPDGVDSLAVGALRTTSDLGSGDPLDGALYIYRIPADDTSVDPATPAVTIYGFTNGWGGFGANVINAGDVNGDGNDDIAVAAPTYKHEGVIHRGKVYILSGAIPNGTSTRIENIPSQFFIGGFIGPEPDAQLGVSLAAGDVDDDGYDDVLFAAPLLDFQADDAGAAWLVYGRSEPYGIVELDDADPNGGSRMFTGVENDHFGRGLTCGDVDGDGYKDVITAAPGYDPGLRTNAGAVFLEYGSGP